MSALLSALAHDKQIIPYRKELNDITGGITSTILLQQFIYWWKKAGNKPFFKFIEPCGHDYYKAGDSWVEELGFTVKEFRTAYRRLEEIGLVSKRIGSDRVTWYSLNTEELEQQVEGLYVNAERAMVTAERAVPVTAERAVHTTNSRLPVDYNSIPPNPQGGSADAPEKPPAKKRAAPAGFGLSDLLADNPHEVSEQTLSDWLACRKALRAPVTKTAWTRINNELAKCVAAGICPDDALAEAQAAGWRGFQYEWIANRKRSQSPARQSGPDFSDTSWANDMGDGL